jgi:hypothetical protein
VKRRKRRTKEAQPLCPGWSKRRPAAQPLVYEGRGRSSRRYETMQQPAGETIEADSPPALSNLLGGLVCLPQ